ncbi:hypothetical protein [Leptolyngbya iicbica]|uniref:Uncharacterized protein n=2 Tax=Cyanophyceae TaxID=3028117 RepID=A0A4Q7E1C0_9CYAN|nr:hypothetical protein [Leptolyngbya sp. LK]RZM75240.1 hypothetical protein DYY88_21665 [Leptolyngbya sp. LK]
MTAQTTQQRPTTQTQQLAVFDNRQAAEAAQNLLHEQEDLSLSNISIEGDINTYEEVAAMGTTVGPEAGLLIGAFSGGVVGVVFVAIYSTIAYGDLVNTTFNQFSIVAFIAAGAIFGLFTGNRIRNAQLPAQKQKGNPDVPRRFQLMVEGDAEALNQAREVLGYPTAS